MNRSSALASGPIAASRAGQLNFADDCGMSGAAVPVPDSDNLGEGRFWMLLSSALACRV